MKKFYMNPANIDRVQAYFTAERPTDAHGYDSGAILHAKNPRNVYAYHIRRINNNIVCIIVNKNADSIEAVLTFSGMNADGITLEKAEIYKNCSVYPSRTETAERYLSKYDQIACIVYGANAAGMLYDLTAERQEAPAADHAETPTEDPTTHAKTAPAQTTAEPTKTPAKDTTTRDTMPAETIARDAAKTAKKCYNIVIYTTAQGVKRADIRTASGRPYMDIPAAELDAIREEIARKDPERVHFNIDDTTTAHTTTPSDSTPRVTKEARTDYRRARLRGHATTEAATTSAEIRSRARNRVKAARTPQKTAGNNYTTHHGSDP